MRKHTGALKYTTYTRSILTVSSKQLIVWRVFRVGRVCARWDGGTFCSGTASEQRERAVNCNKTDSWTAGSMLGSHRLCVRACTHAYVNVGRQCSALLAKVKLQSLTQTETKLQISALNFFFLNAISECYFLLYLIDAAPWKLLYKLYAFKLLSIILFYDLHLRLNLTAGKLTLICAHKATVTLATFWSFIVTEENINCTP